MKCENVRFPKWCGRCGKHILDKGDDHSFTYINTLGQREPLTLCSQCTAKFQAWVSREGERWMK